MGLLGRVRNRANIAFEGVTNAAQAGPHVDLDRKLQILLMQQYRQMAAAAAAPIPFTDVEFSSYSQNGEDGILLYLFSVIGSGGKRAVEIGAGDGVECNSANLVINHGWNALLLDGDPTNIAKGRAHYARRTGAWRLRRLPPTLVQAWISAENINQLIEDHGFGGEVDLLSIDIDGMDYWILQALTCVSARVLVVEFNNRWSADQTVTVPYSKTFVGDGVLGEDAGYFGASLSAFAKLGRDRGYRLIGVNGPATNAFFLREGVGEDRFPAVTVESCLASDYARHQVRTKGAALAGREVVLV